MPAIKGRGHTCSAYACCHHPRGGCRCHYRRPSMRSSLQWGWLSCVPDNQQDPPPPLLFSQTTSPLGLVEPAFIPCHVTLHLHLKLSLGLREYISMSVTKATHESTHMQPGTLFNAPGRTFLSFTRVACRDRGCSLQRPRHTLLAETAAAVCRDHAL